MFRTTHKFISLTALLYWLVSVPTAHAFGSTECAASRYGDDLKCTAGDVSITGIAISGGSISSCVGGTSVMVDLDLTVNSATPKRYDIGIFIANDGNDPLFTPANGGAASCSVGILPPNDPPFRDYDPGPWGGTTDVCGDVNGTMNGGTGSGVLMMTGVTVACQAISGSAGDLYIPFVVSWDNKSSPAGNICASIADPVPNTKSKCNAPTVAQGTVSVVVLPSITKTDGFTLITAGATTTYTVVITNTTGDTLSNAVFTDPAVPDLTVNSVVCSAAGGATCPVTTIAAMQGAGITIPAMPVDSSVTFTIDATLAPTATGTLTNTANVTVRGQTNSISDVDTIVSLDHFSLSHDGAAVNCQAEEITITAHNNTHGVVTTYTGTITLSTSTNNGDWSKTGVAADAQGALTPGAADSGSATYTFVAGDNGSIKLNLKNTHAETVSINVADGTFTETSGSATAADDPALVFATAGFNFLANGAANAIGTQISGKASNVAPGTQTLELQAIKTSDSTGACEAVLTGSNTIELAFECRDPTACTANQVSINGTNIAGNDSGASPLSYTNVSLDFGDATDTTATFTLSYPDAGLLRLHASYVLTPSNEDMLGTSNEFVVRPFGFRITDPPSGRVGPGSVVFTSAGTDFNATLTAVLWEAADDTNNDGVPDSQAVLAGNAATPNFGQETAAATATLSHTLAEPVGGAAGALTVTAPGFTGFSNGAKTQTVSFSEVGIIDLLAQTTNYLGGGQNITAGTSGLTGVGRFTPGYFDVAVTPTCGPMGTEFTYSGQAFTSVTATARAANLGTTTLNYDGTLGFSKNATISDAGDATNFTNNVLAAADFVSGARTQANVTYTFPSKDTVPATLALRAVDAPDGVSSASGGTEPPTEIRSGRVLIQNAFGSELLDLDVPMTAQFYDAAGYFVTNTADTCTDVTLLLGNWQPNLDPVAAPNEETCAQESGSPPLPAGGLSGIGCQDAGLVPARYFREGPSVGFNGDFNLWMRAPGAGNDGSVDITVDLDVSGQPWLKYDWDSAAAGLENPVGRASFGVYKGNSRHIYLRERY